jgi:hypothetical protein
MKQLHFQLRATVTLPDEAFAGAAMPEVRRRVADRLLRELTGDRSPTEIPLTVEYGVYPETELAEQFRTEARTDWEEDGVAIDDDAGVSLVEADGAPVREAWVQGWVYTILPVAADYPKRLCPDCGAPISRDRVDGEACDDCGHVFCYPHPTDGEPDGQERQ